MRFRRVLAFVYVFLPLLLVQREVLWAREDEPLRPRDFKELGVQHENAGEDQFTRELVKQKHYQVKTASVAYVNYEILLRDFPDLAVLSRAEIDQWILDQFGYISELQLKLSGVRNTEIQIDPSRVREFAHPMVPIPYGRASVAPAGLGGRSLGLIDLKGTGHSLKGSVENMLRLQNEAQEQIQKLQAQIQNGVAVEASQRALEDWKGRLEKLRVLDHSDGLASLGESIAEVSKQRAAQMAADIRNAEQLADWAMWETVECYFVMDLGFDILKDNGQKIPAGVVGRQSHVGRYFAGADHFKKFMRDDHGGFQATATRTSVDMGGVVIEVPELKENFGLLHPGAARIDPQATKAWAYGHETALAYRRDRERDPAAAREYVRKHIEDDMTGPLQEKWLKAREILADHPEKKRRALMTQALTVEDDRVQKLILSRLKEKTMTRSELTEAIESTQDHFRGGKSNLVKMNSIALEHSFGILNVERVVEVLNLSSNNDTDIRRLISLMEQNVEFFQNPKIQESLKHHLHQIAGLNRLYQIRIEKLLEKMNALERCAKHLLP